MKLTERILFACVLSGLFSGAADGALPQRKFRRTGASDQPVISPYLNMLNQTQSLETNYFQRAVPELELRSATLQLSDSVRGLNGEMQQVEQRAVSSKLRPTGHKTTFFNAGGYFFGRQQQNAGR